MKATSALTSELRKNTTAVRVSFSWLGTRKTFTDAQRARAADAFGADKGFVSAAQKILDTKHPRFAKLQSLKTEIVNYWRASTLPFTEEGVRLIPRSRIADFQDRMAAYLDDFNEAVSELNNALDELKHAAQVKLGSLYNPAHYPDSLIGFFNLEWDFPSIEPPEYLAQLAPSIYQQEQDRIQAKLTEAVQMAETAFLNEFKELVDTLKDRLTPGEDGQKKVFRDSTVKNLSEFFARFKDLHLGSNDELEGLVSQAQELVTGITPDDLRKGNLLRQEIASGLANIGEKLTPLVANQPRRKIIKPTKETPNAIAPAVNSPQKIPA